MDINNNASGLNMFTRGGKAVSDLSRFTALCEMLGNPHYGLKFVHIAGTNGKGSVSEYISRAMVSQGYKTGKFTSPYIYNIRERIQIRDKLISQKDFDENVSTTVNAARKTKTPTEFSQFEILTAAAFLHFSKKKTDIVVLETGIGGLLDCTNVIIPEISVITAIDFDHSEILGSQLHEIAAHKAGIIKEGVGRPAPPCVMYPVQERAAYIEIKKRAEKTGAELIVPDTDMVSGEKVSVYGNSFCYNGEEFETVMGGRHQVLNALTAIETLKALGIETAHIQAGLKAAQIPARMQIVRKNPMVVLDGAHNRQGVAAVKELFGTWRVRKAVVFGMLNGKDYIGAIKELLEFAHYLVFTDGFAENAVSCSDLYRVAALFGFERENIFTVSRPRKALELAEELCGGGIVLVMGSMRLAEGIK